jgi:tryptophan synthase alpha chain
VRPGAEVLAQRFAALREAGRPALVCYATAGHPDAASTPVLWRALEEAGADVLEVGVPFSDPLADGPIIQASSQRALEHGVTFDRALDLIAAARLSIPVVLFSYLNPVLAAGTRALDRAAQAGAHGVLITDLPVGADPERERWFGDGPLAFVRLVAPTTPRDRLREIARTGSGFVYLISRLGVTGAREDVAESLPATVGELRRVTTLPVCVGFGVSRPDQARRFAAYADGVVVGSAIVRAAGEGGVSAAAALVRDLRRALDDVGTAGGR